MNMNRKYEQPCCSLWFILMREVKYKHVSLQKLKMNYAWALKVFPIRLLFLEVMGADGS